MENNALYYNNIEYFEKPNSIVDNYLSYMRQFDGTDKPSNVSDEDLVDDIRSLYSAVMLFIYFYVCITCIFVYFYVYIIYI